MPSIGIESISSIAPKPPSVIEKTARDVVDRGEFLLNRGKKYVREAVESIRPPIDSEKGFNPTQELADILNSPKGERPEQLETFKNRLRYHLNGLVRVEEAMMRAVTEMPDANLETLKAMASDHIKRYGGNEGTVSYAGRQLERLVERRQNIVEVMEKYPTPESLYTGLFGRAPTGPVVVEFTPVNIRIRCDSWYDLSYVVGGEYSSQSVPAFKTLVQEGRCQGRLIPECLEPKLDNAVTVVASDTTPRFQAHEDYHALCRLTAEEGEGVLLDVERPEDMFERLRGTEPEVVHQNLRPYLEAISDAATVPQQEELLAYLQQGFTAVEAYWETKLPIYHYNEQTAQYLSGVLGASGLDPETQRQAQWTINKVFGLDHDIKYAKTVEIVEGLRKHGFSALEIGILFRNQPLSRWQKIAKRVI